MSIYVNCPGCQKALTIGEHLQGKQIRCKKCGNVFLVETPPELDEEEEGSDTQEQIQQQPRSSKHRAVWEEEEEAPRRKRRRSEESPLSAVMRNRRIMIALMAAGGFALFLLGGMVVSAILIWPEMFDGDFRGSWPDASGPAGYGAGIPEDNIVTLHFTGVDENTYGTVYGKSSALADGGHASYICGSHKGDRATIRLGIVQDPQACADKIDFGTVRRVKGRVISVVAHKVDGPPPDADMLTKTLYDLKSPMIHRRHDAVERLKKMAPNERRAEVARALAEALQTNADPFTSKDIVELLTVWGSKDDVPALLKALNTANRHDIFTLQAIFHALAQFKDERACEPIALYLEDFATSHEAAEALKKMGSIAEKSVLKRLQHPDQFVRQTVCEILAAIGTKESLPALKAIAEQNDFFLSGRAQSAIRAIKARGK